MARLEELHAAIDELIEATRKADVRPATAPRSTPKPKPGKPPAGGLSRADEAVEGRWQRDRGTSLDIDCSDPRHHHCVTCGCPMWCFVGERPRISCVRCIARGDGLHPGDITELPARSNDPSDP